MGRKQNNIYRKHFVSDATGTYNICQVICKAPSSCDEEDRYMTDEEKSGNARTEKGKKRSKSGAGKKSKRRQRQHKEKECWTCNIRIKVSKL